MPLQIAYCGASIFVLADDGAMFVIGGSLIIEVVMITNKKTIAQKMRLVRKLENTRS